MLLRLILATVHDIDAMHAVRLEVRENVFSDANSVRPEHYRAMLLECGRGWVHEESHKVVAFEIAEHARRNIWALLVAPGLEGQVIATTGRNTRAEHFRGAAGGRVVVRRLASNSPLTSFLERFAATNV